MPDLPLIVVTGLRAEARLVARPGVRTIVGGGDSHRLSTALDRAVAEGCCGLLSFGVAGGLEPGLRAGTLIVADAVMEGHQRIACDRSLSDQLRSALPDASGRTMIGVDAPVMSPEQKASLHNRTAAAAVDMESHIAARAAAAAGLPFAVIRVIADRFDRTVPAAAVAGMRSDGTADIAAVLRELVRDPGQLLPLLHVAVDSTRAFAVLRSAAFVAVPVALMRIGI